MAWQLIHMLPQEGLKAARDLNARRLFPVHSCKFVMANHAWDEPLKSITELNKEDGQLVITPMIGEKVELKNQQQTFKAWWQGLDA